MTGRAGSSSAPDLQSMHECKNHREDHTLHEGNVLPEPVVLVIRHISVLIVEDLARSVGIHVPDALPPPISIPAPLNLTAVSSLAGHECCLT